MEFRIIKHLENRLSSKSLEIDIVSFKDSSKKGIYVLSLINHFFQVLIEPLWNDVSNCRFMRSIIPQNGAKEVTKDIAVADLTEILKMIVQQCSLLMIHEQTVSFASLVLLAVLLGLFA